MGTTVQMCAIRWWTWYSTGGIVQNFLKNSWTLLNVNQSKGCELLLLRHQRQSIYPRLKCRWIWSCATAKRHRIIIRQLRRSILHQLRWSLERLINSLLLLTTQLLKHRHRRNCFLVPVQLIRKRKRKCLQHQQKPEGAKKNNRCRYAKTLKSMVISLVKISINRGVKSILN